MKKLELPSFVDSTKRIVAPSAFPTMLSVENELPELAEFLALTILSPLSLLSIHDTTRLLLTDVRDISLTEFEPLKVSGVPYDSPPLVDLLNSVL